jgi:ribosomal protein S18 acetylase RimI-like enzyme
MIARLDLTAINDLHEALPRLAHVPLPHLHHLNSDQRRAHWLDEISKSLADESSIAFAWIASGTINGFIVYNDSPWDSQITRRRIGNIKHLAVATDDHAATEILQELIDELTRTLGKRETQCVACRVQSSELAAIHALEQSGFLLMDTLLDFVFDFSLVPTEQTSRAQRDKRLKTRRAEPADMSALMAISERAFAGYFGRYHADSRIPRSTATKIYSEWLRSAFAGWADWILVAEFDDQIVGHSVWRKILERQDANSRGVASCDLLVVDPEFQGRRLGKALVRDGMEISRDFARYLVTPLHVCNYSVQRTFQNLGWRIAGARHSFHKWLKP